MHIADSIALVCCSCVHIIHGSSVNDVLQNQKPICLRDGNSSILLQKRRLESIVPMRWQSLLCLVCPATCKYWCYLERSRRAAANVGKKSDHPLHLGYQLLSIWMLQVCLKWYILSNKNIKNTIQNSK